MVGEALAAVPTLLAKIGRRLCDCLRAATASRLVGPLPRYCDGLHDRLFASRVHARRPKGPTTCLRGDFWVPASPDSLKMGADRRKNCPQSRVTPENPSTPSPPPRGQQKRFIMRIKAGMNAVIVHRTCHHRPLHSSRWPALYQHHHPLPNTCLPSRCGHLTVVMKNCEEGTPFPHWPST